MVLKVIFKQYYNYIIQDYKFLESNLAMHIKNPIMYSDSLTPILRFWPQEISIDVDKDLYTKVSLQHTLY